MGKKNDDDNKFDPVEYLEAMAAELGVGVVKPSTSPEELKDDIRRACNLLHSFTAVFWRLASTRNRHGS